MQLLQFRELQQSGRFVNALLILDSAALIPHRRFVKNHRWDGNYPRQVTDIT
jgi:hypothetical protein